MRPEQQNSKSPRREEFESRESSISIEIHTFESGRNIVLFKPTTPDIPASMMPLEPESNSSEYLVRTSFTQAFIESGWFTARFPDIHPDPEQEFLLTVLETDRTPRVRVVDPLSGGFSTESKKLKKYELLETTTYPEETPTLVAQKMRVKGALREDIQLELAKISVGSPAQVMSLTETPLGTVYAMELTEIHARKTIIDGDPESPNQQFNPKKRAEIARTKGNELVDPHIQLLKQGDILIFTLDETGEPTFYSPYWGRPGITNYETWEIGEPPVKPIAQINEATKNLRDPHRVKPKILRHLVAKLVADNTMVIPNREVFSEQQTIETYVGDKISEQLSRVSQYDTEMFTVTSYLKNGWLPEEVNKLFEQYTLLNEDTRKKFFENKLNLLPEQLIEKIFNVNMNREETISLFAQYDAAINLKAHIDNLERTAALGVAGALDGSMEETTHTRNLTVLRELASYDKEVPEAMTRMGRAAIEQMKPDFREEFGKEAAIFRQGNFIRDRLIKLEGQDRIQSLGIHNIQEMRPLTAGDTFVLAAQFCPLYEDDERPFSEYANIASVDDLTGTETDILSSGVGPKLIATKSVVRELKTSLEQMGVKLRLKATFGDVGVVVSKREWADPDRLTQQAAIYEKVLRDFCDEQGVELHFDRISDYSQEDLPETHKVPQYVVVEEGTTLDHQPTLEEALSLLGLEGQLPLKSRSQQDDAHVFLKRFAMSDGNLELTRGLVHTYVTLLPLVTENADAQLGMELADIFLSLTTALPKSRQARMPAINVLVA